MLQGLLHLAALGDLVLQLVVGGLGHSRPDTRLFSVLALGDDGGRDKGRHRRDSKEGVQKEQLPWDGPSRKGAHPLGSPPQGYSRDDKGGGDGLPRAKAQGRPEDKGKDRIVEG